MRWLLNAMPVLLLMLFAPVGPLPAVTQSVGERDTDFNIVLEQRTEKPEGYQANMTTTSVYPCEGYSLRTRIRWDGDTVSIFVLGLVRPVPCIQSSSQASGTAFIGELKQGPSFLRIHYRGEVDLHKIVRAKFRVTAYPIRRTFTELRGN